MNKLKIAQGLAVLLLSVFVIVGCTKIENNKDKKKPTIKQSISSIAPEIKTVKEKLLAQSIVKKFESEEEFAEFFENNEQSVPGGYGGSFGMGRGDVMFEMDSVSESMPVKNIASKAEMSAPATGAGSDDFSKTNVQVEGVDEADIVKSDGKYIYAVTNNSLLIIDAYPADTANILSEIKFKSRPENIYLNGDRMVVYGRNNTIHENENYNRFKRRGSYTFLKVFDIKDRKNPKQVRNLDIEGGYTDSRMIGDYIYFVTTTHNYRYFENEPIAPRILEDGEALASKCADNAKCFEPEIYYFDIPYSNYKFTTITSINVNDDEKAIQGEVYLLSSGQEMFVSLDNMYITYTKYMNEYDLESEVIREIIFPILSEKDQDKITKIEAVESYILSISEKSRKIRQIVERYAESLTQEAQEKLEKDLEEKMVAKYKDISKELEKTVVHKISIDKGDIEYKTFGEVTGRVLNQFSMDESDGYFRIATTRSRQWSRYEEAENESYSNLYVLDENMKIVGSLEGLAKDERIYSVRFMQNRAYMVTFKQMDPLFVIDLKDPRNPKVLGELKIPGYSDYLHPYDDDTLIGLGKDTYVNEYGGVRTKGLKLSLFDVSDVSSPREVDTYIIGDTGSDSIALRDHKAFLFSKEKNLLSIPVRLRQSTDEFSYGKFVFGGAAVFNITKEGFDLKGKIDHSDGKEGTQDYWGGYRYYDNTVKRCLYINDTLYTMSGKYLKMNKLNDLSLVKKLELKKKQWEEDFEIIN